VSIFFPISQMPITKEQKAEYNRRYREKQKLKVMIEPEEPQQSFLSNVVNQPKDPTVVKEPSMIKTIATNVLTQTIQNATMLMLPIALKLGFSYLQSSSPKPKPSIPTPSIPSPETPQPQPLDNLNIIHYVPL